MDHNKVNIEFILALIIISVKFQDHVDISKSKSLSVINLQNIKFDVHFVKKERENKCSIIILE